MVAKAVSMPPLPPSLASPPAWNGHIAKPVRQDELFDAIRMILESRETAGQIYIC